MLERFFERRGDKFVHRGVENELRVAAGFKEKWMKRRINQSKQKQNEATSGKINGLGAATGQDSTVHKREDNKLEAGRGSEVDRTRVRNGFQSLAQLLHTDNGKSEFVPRENATSESTEHLKDFNEAASLA
jgi:hypothetical protein